MGFSKIVEEQNLPKHVAIIMDGNGRWAERRFLPRVAGHQKGVESVRAIVEAAVKKRISCLTLFAFSSENRNRGEDEVSFLFNLILKVLRKEIDDLHKNNIKLQIIGERALLNEELRQQILDAEKLTKSNTGLKLNIALNYGGRWDIVQAAKMLSQKVAAGELLPKDITESLFTESLALHGQIEPDLLIRTSGEERISNFLLWQIAYTELYFTNTFWPDFREAEFDAALAAFSKRKRRFGKTDSQIDEEKQCL